MEFQIVRTEVFNSIVEEKTFSFGGDDGGGLELECGRSLQSVDIRYETYGELDAAASNAILVCHALTGDAHLAGRRQGEDAPSGWWNAMVGPGRPFDTDRYFIVCSNVLGGCMGSTCPNSLNPATGSPYRMDFPVITIADMVRAQKRLMEHLGITKWLSVAGGSMGGMQALQWSVSYPENVDSVMAIATTSRLSPQAIAFDWVGRHAIMSDPAWNGGNYEDGVPESGLAIARMLGHITYLSDESMRRKFGRRLQEKESYSFDFTKDFQVESYLEHQGNRFVSRFDANSYLYMTRAMDYFDLAPDGDLRAAFAKTKSPFMIVSFSSDWLFPPENSREIVKALRNNNVEVTYCEMESDYGHDAFLLETETLGRLMTDYLRARENERG